MHPTDATSHVSPHNHLPHYQFLHWTGLVHLDGQIIYRPYYYVPISSLPNPPHCGPAIHELSCYVVRHLLVVPSKMNLVLAFLIFNLPVFTIPQQR